MYVYQSCSCAYVLLLLANTHVVLTDELQRIVSDRLSLQNLYASTVQQGLPQVRQQRGIVIPSGGGQMLANAYVGVKVIRDYLACDLPIEIAYFGEHEIDSYHEHLFRVR